MWGGDGWGDRLSGQMNSLVIFSRHEGLLTVDGVRREKPAVLCFPRKEAWEGEEYGDSFHVLLLPQGMSGLRGEEMRRH